VTLQIERQEHRRASIVTQVQCERLMQEIIVVSRDVSVGGISLVARQQLPLGSSVCLSFRLNPNDPTISCAGTVISSLSGVGMGIQSLDLGNEPRALLQKFVDEAN
jgi:ethanolamine ammonia-lyase large subunit